MIGKTNEKKYAFIISSIFKSEIKHIKENWALLLVCFFIAKQNIIDEIFPFAIVVLCTYCQAKGSPLIILAVTILAVLSSNISFAYTIMLIAIYAYFFSFRDEKKSILIVAGYSSLVLLISKTTLLIADGFNAKAFMLNIYETIFVFSSIILINELIKIISKIKKQGKVNSHRININSLPVKQEAVSDLDRKNASSAQAEAVSTAAEESSAERKDIRDASNYKKTKILNIFTDQAKLKIKEQLLWQNIHIKFFEVLPTGRNFVVLSLTVKTEKPCEETERAVELIVRNVCGIKLKCVDRVISSPNYYVLKFKNIKRIKIRTYAAAAVKDGSEVSGDSYAYAGRADKYYTVLCDGIGSGKEAYSESNGAVGLLSKFIYTDFSEEQILRTLNSILMIKLGDERFVTFDFNIIDYSSRELRVYKAGAAPTYIVSSRNVDKISGKSLPLGILNNFEYSSFKKKVEVGDMIIMVSDGIIDSIGLDEKKSLDKYIELIINKDPQTIANSILGYALRGQETVMDDMTVLVTKIG